jgi:hypothetical protein
MNSVVLFKVPLKGEAKSLLSVTWAKDVITEMERKREFGAHELQASSCLRRSY